MWCGKEKWEDNSKQRNTTHVRLSTPSFTRLVLLRSAEHFVENYHVAGGVRCCASDGHICVYCVHLTHERAIPRLEYIFHFWVYTEPREKYNFFFCFSMVARSRDYSSESMAFCSRRVGCSCGITRRRRKKRDDDDGDSDKAIHGYATHSPVNEISESIFRTNTKFQIIIRHFGHDAAKKAEYSKLLAMHGTETVDALTAWTVSEMKTTEKKLELDCRSTDAAAAVATVPRVRSEKAKPKTKYNKIQNIC